MAKCKSKSCTDKCGDNLSGFFKGQYNSAVECAVNNKCISYESQPPKHCGDGKCADGENFENCPQDCEKPNLCGNGKCDEGENPDNCGQDCKAPNLCGNGKCDDGENPDNCAQDCKAPNPCGNGKCDAGETNENCAQDCPKPPDPGKAYTCIVDECGLGWCNNMGWCKSIIECLSKCADQACADKCGENLNGFFKSQFEGNVKCALDNKCLTFGPVVDPCGNGKCDPGENLNNCPEDCKPGEDKCGNDQCDPGESAEACPKDCKPTAGSCKGKCGQFSPGACHCDAKCVEFGNCCSDYKILCGDDKTCGNDKCDDGETADICPQDCGSSAYKCLLDECNAGQCSNANQCSKALACIAECSTKNCANKCTDGQPNNNKQYLNNIIGCGFDDNQCLGPKCGNDKCETGETAENCSADCKVSDDPMVCINLQCANELKQCTQDFKCTVTLQCTEKCKGDSDCAEDCGDDLDDGSEKAYESVLKCAESKKCLTEKDD